MPAGKVRAAPPATTTPRTKCRMVEVGHARDEVAEGMAHQHGTAIAQLSRGGRPRRSASTRRLRPCIGPGRCAHAARLRPQHLEARRGDPRRHVVEVFGVALRGGQHHHRRTAGPRRSRRCAPGRRSAARDGVRRPRRGAQCSAQAISARSQRRRMPTSRSCRSCRTNHPRGMHVSCDGGLDSRGRSVRMSIGARHWRRGARVAQRCYASWRHAAARRPQGQRSHRSPHAAARAGRRRSRRSRPPPPTPRLRRPLGPRQRHRHDALHAGRDDLGGLQAAFLHLGPHGVDRQHGVQARLGHRRAHQRQRIGLDGRRQA